MLVLELSSLLQIRPGHIVGIIHPFSNLFRSCKPLFKHRDTGSEVLERLKGTFEVLIIELGTRRRANLGLNARTNISWIEHCYGEDGFKLIEAANVYRKSCWIIGCCCDVVPESK